ncbi:hypothetical protein QR685DRAFT_445967, partial [Neurospora intermedia]
KPKKDILAKKAISATTNALAYNISTNFTTPAATTNFTLLYKSGIFIGLNGLGSSSMDFC